MASFSVYLIQEDESAINELMKALDKEKFSVIGSSLDGEIGASEVMLLKPDIVITGITIHKIDGLEVIDRIAKSLPNTKIIVYSSIFTEDIAKNAISRGAAYYLVRPISARLLSDRIYDLAQGQSRKNSNQRMTSLDEKISKIFISVGIPPHIKGYSYLREGVKMAVNEPTIINCITKQLYPKIGEKYETTPSKVERAIRHAIEVAWNRGRIESINSLFGVRAYSSGEKPTNGEFIALIADKMLLEGA